jgi:hypothetical protein
MAWTSAQRDEVAREYARIGIGKGDLLPVPADRRLTEPAGLLGLLRGIPDGAGVPGMLDALRQHGSGKS